MRLFRLSLFIGAVMLLTKPTSTTEILDFQEFRKKANKIIPGKFTFVRIQYDSVGGYGESHYYYDGRDWQRWETDYPDADENLMFRLAELSTIDVNPKTEVRRLTDPDLCNFPLIYMSDVGWQDLSKKEKEALRTYLLRGGFLWLDDFWGFAEFENFDRTMRELFPNNRYKEIPKNHPIMSIVFPFKECPQIPAIDFAAEGWKWDPPWIHKMPTQGGGDLLGDGVEHVNFRGYEDDKGRLMVVCTHNTDFGDGFEREAENEWYFQTYSTQAYGMAINIITYAMSH